MQKIREFIQARGVEVSDSTIMVGMGGLILSVMLVIVLVQNVTQGRELAAMQTNVRLQQTEIELMRKKLRETEVDLTSLCGDVSCLTKTVATTNDRIAQLTIEKPKDTLPASNFVPVANKPQMRMVAEAMKPQAQPRRWYYLYIW
jgi:hypothetical protein